MLSFLAMDDSRSGILTQRQLAFASHFGVTQESERYIFVVRRSLRVTQDFCHLLIVRAAKHKTHVMESLLRHEGQRLRLNQQNLCLLIRTLKADFRKPHMVFGQQIILSLVFSELKHRCIFKLCHI